MYELIIDELIQTELSYCEDLKFVIEGYIQPFKKNMLMKNQIFSYFSNLEEIYKFNSELKEQLCQNQNNIVQLLDVLIDNKSKFLDFYGKYCSNYPLLSKRHEKLKENYDIFDMFMSQQKIFGHLLPIISYLVKPVQRILKYGLFLKSINEASLKNNSKIPNLNDVESSMNDVCNDIDKMQFIVNGVVNMDSWAIQIYNLQGLSIASTGLWIFKEEFRNIKTKINVVLIICEKIILECKLSNDLKFFHCIGGFLVKTSNYISMEDENLFGIAEDKNINTYTTRKVNIIKKFRETFTSIKNSGPTDINKIRKSEARKYIMAEEVLKSIVDDDIESYLFKDEKSLYEHIKNNLKKPKNYLRRSLSNRCISSFKAQDGIKDYRTNVDESNNLKDSIDQKNQCYEMNEIKSKLLMLQTEIKGTGIKPIAKPKILLRNAVINMGKSKISSTSISDEVKILRTRSNESTVFKFSEVPSLDEETIKTPPQIKPKPSKDVALAYKLSIVQGKKVL